MRLSHFITIYLAAAAPLAVTYYLHRSAQRRGVRAVASSAGVALAWPLWLLVRHLRSGGHRLDVAATLLEPPASADEDKVRRAERALLSALYLTEDLALESFGVRHGRACDAARGAAAGVERYAELTLAARRAREDAPPLPEELELARVAGRSCDDLLVAGRCLHRRNVARLRAHQAQARGELLRALDELGAAFDSERAGRITDAGSRRRLHSALIEDYARAIELFSLLEDERAVWSVARLLDGACARSYQTERQYQAGAPAPAPVRAEGGESRTAPLSSSHNTPTLPAHGQATFMRG